ncbi:hypothetical protein AAC387_Pa01g2168 [Persea americana]
MKEDDPDIAIVCMTGARHGILSTRSTAHNSSPVEGEESNNTSEGHVTPVTDDETLLTGKNIRGMGSPVLRDIDNDVSLASRSLKSNFSPHTGPGKYSIFMAGETSAPANV